MAELTRAVEEMTLQLKGLRERADDQLERSNTQQERVDLAARELTEVGDRLQGAVNALRQSMPIGEPRGGAQASQDVRVRRAFHALHGLKFFVGVIFIGLLAISVWPTGAERRLRRAVAPR